MLEWDDFSLYEGALLTSRLHVGFVAPSHGRVDAFWRALVDAGHRDDGAPGSRPQYRPDYYGAFVLDPDRWRTIAELMLPSVALSVPRPGRLIWIGRVRFESSSTHILLLFRQRVMARLG
ncbi:MAG: hypothetical protein ACM3QU_03805 [Verrucomicrobiota bacterium]